MGASCYNEALCIAIGMVTDNARPSTPHSTALELLLQACCFEELSGQACERLRVACETFAREHAALPPWEQTEALRKSPCVIWAFLIHADAVLSPDLPPAFMPATLLPADRLPTQAEWFAPGPWPCRGGPVRGSHAAVLRVLIDRPGKQSSAQSAFSGGFQNEGSQADEVWKIWRKMAGFFLATLADYFPQGVPNRQHPLPPSRQPLSRVQELRSDPYEGRQWRRASEPLGQRPFLGNLKPIQRPFDDQAMSYC